MKTTAPITEEGYIETALEQALLGRSLCGSRVGVGT